MKRSIVILLLVLGSMTPAAADTYHVTFPSFSTTSNPCDSLNCEGFFEVYGSDGYGALFPLFSMTGKVLQAVQIVYDAGIHAESIGTNTTNGPVVAFVSNYGSFTLVVSGTLSTNAPIIVLSDEHCAIAQCNVGSASVLPGQSVGLGAFDVGVHGAQVFVPGDALFSIFLGPGEGTLYPRGTISEHGQACILDPSVPTCGGFNGLPELAPILLSATYSGTFDVTYRYCTPGEDRGCPVAIAGFNSPVPTPSTWVLLGFGVVVLLFRSTPLSKERV